MAGPGGGKAEEGDGRCLSSLPPSKVSCSSAPRFFCLGARPPRTLRLTLPTFGGDLGAPTVASGWGRGRGLGRVAGAAAVPPGAAPWLPAALVAAVPVGVAGGQVKGPWSAPSFPFGFFGTDAVGPIFELYATGRDARSWPQRWWHGVVARSFRGAFFVTVSRKVQMGGGGEATVFPNSPSVVYLCTSRVHAKRVSFATPEIFFFLSFFLPFKLIFLYVLRLSVSFREIKLTETRYPEACPQ